MVYYIRDSKFNHSRRNTMAKDKYSDKAAGRSVSKEKDVYADAKSPKAAVAKVEPSKEPKEGEKAETSAPKVRKGSENIASYLTSAQSRRKNIPANVIEAAGSSKTKGQAKRVIRQYLREVGAA